MTLSLITFAMSAKEVKGEISQKLNFENCVEWTFEDFLSYTKEDERYYSPTFSIAGSGWYLRMYPNGETEHKSVGWIGLYLMRGSDGWAPLMTVNYDLGVKTVNGEVELKTKNVCRVFEKVKGQGIPKFLQRSELLEKKSELLPYGALTVICTMRVKDFLDCTSNLIELSNDFKNMLVSKEACDATLKVQDKEFPVHRSVLASRSTVFGAMFQSDMKEKNTGVVEIDECHPEAFKDFLKYIYCGQFENSADVTELYKIAHKYCVGNLKATCVRFMVNNLSVDNVCDFFILGNLFDEPELKGESQEFVNQYFEDVALTDKWDSLFSDNPKLAKELITNMAKHKQNKRK